MDGAGELDVEDLGREKWSPSIDENGLEKSDELGSKLPFEVSTEHATKPADHAFSMPWIPSTPSTRKPTTSSVHMPVTPLLADRAEPIKGEISLLWYKLFELLQGSSAPKKSFESPLITGTNVTMLKKQQQQQQQLRPVPFVQSSRPVLDWKSRPLKQNLSSSDSEITQQYLQPVTSITQSLIRTEAKFTQGCNSKPFQKPAAITKCNQFAKDINFSNPSSYDRVMLQSMGTPDQPCQQPVAAITTTASPMYLFKNQLQQIKNAGKSEELKKTQPAPSPYILKRNGEVADMNNSREPSHLRKDEKGVNDTPVLSRQAAPRPQPQQPNNFSGHPPPQSPMFSQQRPKGYDLLASGGTGNRSLLQANEHKNNWQSSGPALPLEKDERQLQESQWHHQNVLTVTMKGILKNPLISKSDDTNFISQSRNAGGPADQGWNGMNASQSGGNSQNKEHEQHAQPRSNVQYNQPMSNVQHDQCWSKDHDQSWSTAQHDPSLSKGECDQSWVTVLSENQNFPPPHDNFDQRPDYSTNPGATSDNPNQTTGISYCPLSGPIGTSAASELAPFHFPPPPPVYSSTEWSLLQSNTKDDSDGVMPSNHEDHTMYNIHTGSKAPDCNTNNSYERQPTNSSVPSGGTGFSRVPHSLPPEQGNVQPTSQSFDVNEAYRTLERLVPSLDVLGLALDALILVARQRGSTTPHALKLFVDPEHINLMNLCLVNFDEQTRSSSLSQGRLLHEGVAQGRKLLEFANQHCGEDVTTAKRTDTLNMKAIATATVGQSQEAIIMFIRNAAAYKGLDNLTNDELSDVYLKVQDLQKAQSIVDE